MKKILLLLVLIFSCCSGNKKKNDQIVEKHELIKKNSLDELNLKGEVKSLREFSYKAVDKFGEITKGDKERENSWEYDIHMEFNETGNQTEKSSYKPDGSLRYKYTYKYDDKGNEIEVNNYKPDGSLDFKYTYKYDDKGNLIGENTYKPDGSLGFKYTYKYEYDQQGNWIQKIEFENYIPKFILEREIEYY